MTASPWTLNSQFQTAIQFNDFRAAECLLSQGFDSDFRFGNNRIPALCLAAKSGHLGLVELLIEHRCSLNQCDENGLSALHYACNYLQINVARLLLKNRADPNAVNKNGYCPLHLAVHLRSLGMLSAFRCSVSTIPFSPELVTLLVQSGALIEKRDLFEQTPLLIACRFGAVDVVRYLLGVGANPHVLDRDGNSSLLLAINSTVQMNTALVKLLLEAGVDPNVVNDVGACALLTAIRRSSDHLTDGQLTVDALIQAGCDVNRREYGTLFGEDALSLSISRGQDAITEKLLRCGSIDTQARSMSPYSPFIRLLQDEKHGLAKLCAASMPNLTQLDWERASGQHRASIARNDRELNSFLFGHSTRSSGDDDACSPSPRYFPRLKHLCRHRLRVWLGNRADSVIQNWPLPDSFKQYLHLNHL